MQESSRRGLWDVKTAAQVEAEFRADLQALLNKHNAELCVEESINGYYSYSSKMVVYIDGVYGETEFTDIDLGSAVYHD